MRANPDKDWSGDFSHENGQYINACGECGDRFVGHKSRTLCRECFEKEQGYCPTCDVYVGGICPRHLSAEKCGRKTPSKKHRVWRVTLTDETTCTLNTSEPRTKEFILNELPKMFIGNRLKEIEPHG